MVVGDGGGGAGGETLRWLANHQIADRVTVVIAPSGNLDMNGQTDTAGALTLQRTKNLAPTIDTTGLTLARHRDPAERGGDG